MIFKFAPFNMLIFVPLINNIEKMEINNRVPGQNGVSGFFLLLCATELMPRQVVMSVAVSCHDGL